jgi:hypothetical protein
MGWRFQWRKRTKIAPGTHLHWQPWKVLRGFLDGPGGSKPREGFTSASFRFGPFRWNSRGRTTIDTPGPGYITREGRRRGRG